MDINIIRNHIMLKKGILQSVHCARLYLFIAYNPKYWSRRAGLQKVFFSLRAQNFMLKNCSGYKPNFAPFWWILTNFNSNLA